MKFLGIIPARFASTRFPGKPLAAIGGKTMIQRVFEQAKKSRLLSEVIIATDDYRIADHVKEFGGNVELTSVSHQSGTDRCAEVSTRNPGYDIIINIQGDEPFIDPEQIDLVCECFNNPTVVIATLIKSISVNDELFDNNIPKVIVNRLNEAIYFSRTAIPFFRELEPAKWLKKYQYYKHIGIYGYKDSTLQIITKLPVSGLEKAEALEQLRWIENGFKIHTALTDFENFSIDTPQDLQKALKRIKL